jgi:hypothetical protein
MDQNHLITVEVHYTEQDFEGFYDGSGKEPTYRLFLDDELFTERSWLYNDRTYLLENVQFKSSIAEHTILVEPIAYPLPEVNYFDFELRNLVVDGVPVEPAISGNKLHFTINTVL